jgi:Spy/CpxP family protein refolding chaperone
MKRMKQLAMAVSLVSLIAAGAGPAAGQSRMGMGPGMMGPGMMGGYGMGPGMMGPGMMGGYGGMMGGACPGCGMMGMGPGMMAGFDPELDQEQRAKIAQLQDEARRKQWDVMGQMREEQFKLEQLYYADKQDPAAIGAQYKRVQDLNRRLVELSAETQNRLEGVLKPEQRQQARRYWRGGMMWAW